MSLRPKNYYNIVIIVIEQLNTEKNDIPYTKNKNGIKIKATAYSLFNKYLKTL